MTIVDRLGPSPIIPSSGGQANDPGKVATKVPTNAPTKVLTIGPGVGASTATAAPVQKAPNQAQTVTIIKLIYLGRINSAYHDLEIAVQNNVGVMAAWNALLTSVRIEMLTGTVSRDNRYDGDGIERVGQHIVDDIRNDKLKDSKKIELIKMAVLEVNVNLIPDVLSSPDVTIKNNTSIAQNPAAKAAIAYAARWIPQWGDGKKQFESLYTVIEDAYNIGVAPPILAEVVAQCRNALIFYHVPWDDRKILENLKQYIGNNNSAAKLVIEAYGTRA